MIIKIWTRTGFFFLVAQKVSPWLCGAQDKDGRVNCSMTVYTSLCVPLLALPPPSLPLSYLEILVQRTYTHSQTLRPKGHRGPAQIGVLFVICTGSGQGCAIRTALCSSRPGYLRPIVVSRCWYTEQVTSVPAMDERRRHCDGQSSKKATKIITKALCVYQLIDSRRGKGKWLLMGGGGGGGFWLIGNKQKTFNTTY